MLKEYLITFFGNETRRSVVIRYVNHHLQQITLPENEKWEANAIMWLGSFVRHVVTDKDLWDYQSDTSKTFNFQVQPVPLDLSFEKFWNTYNYKVGNKGKAQKLWKLLNQEDKIKALCRVTSYNYFLQINPNTEKIYPERYLSQRRFENEYK